MGYERQHFRVGQKWSPRVRHARVSLGVVRCVDCLCELPSTHVFQRFGNQCYTCWSADVRAVSGLVVGGSL